MLKLLDLTESFPKKTKYFFRDIVQKIFFYVEIKINNYRILYLKSKFRSCGLNVTFQLPIVINEPEKIDIGNDVSFAAYLHIWSSGGVKIGNRVMVGSHTAITSITHDYSSDVVMYGTIVLKPVVISDDVWIGTHVVVLPGVTIGRGAVIGAGCVVTKDVPEFAIVAGVPGRILKQRFPKKGD